MKRRASPFGLVLLFVFITVAVTVALSCAYWDELKADDGETVRNVGLLTGGVVAMGLALWRSRIAERQVEATEFRSLDEQFQRAAEMLGHDDVSVRIGGVASLHHLARNDFDRYGWRVVRILDKFSESRRQRNGNHDVGPVVRMDRQVGGRTKSYRGGIDGVEAFDSFWDLQERAPGSKRSRWQRLQRWGKETWLRSIKQLRRDT